MGNKHDLVRAQTRIKQLEQEVEDLKRLVGLRALDGEIKWQVLMDAYDWTYDVETGEIHGLVAGDQGWEGTGIIIPDLAPGKRRRRP